MNKEEEHSVRQKQVRIEDSDWLSSLPDSVLIDILSRLMTKEMIQTCVLSKKWKKLWTFVPCLELYYFNRETSKNESQHVERLENFVSMALRLRDNATDLHTFKFFRYNYEDRTRISGNVALAWILSALNHNAKNLSIVLLGKGLISLPDCLFTCESLEVVKMHLEMEEGKVEIKPDNVCLPRLRNLSFGCASFNSDYMGKLLIGCPVLESLQLFDCSLEMDNISFRNLKKLLIFCCYFVREGHLSTGRVSAPGLEYLDFNGKIGSRIKLEDMSTVTKAIITIQYDYTEIDYDLELLSSLSGVENLQLHSFLLKDTLIGELPKCPTFNNLKYLTLGEGCMYCNFRMLLSFLSHCPNLEFLTLSHQDDDYEDEDIEEELSQDQEQIESFGCSRLKKIDIFYTRPDSHVDRLMRILLQSTLEIEDLQIIFSNCRPDDFPP